MKISFKKFPIYQGISKTSRMACDISESLANCIYSNVPGIAAHVLAEKIYRSEEDTELSVDEIAIVRRVTELLPGMYADSINDHIKELEGKEETA